MQSCNHAVTLLNAIIKTPVDLEFHLQDYWCFFVFAVIERE